MEYHNNVANGFSVQIDDEGNFSGIVQSCPAFKAGKEFSGNVHSLSMKEECIIDGILTECFDLRSKEGKAVYKALLNADDEEEVAEVVTEEHEAEQNEIDEGTSAEEQEEKPTFYGSMYDYVENADLSYYEISDGTIRETPFVEEIKPFDDPDFILVADGIVHEGKWYIRVNFGEHENSYLLESALYDTVYLVYIEESCGHYVTDGRVYETEEEAEA